MRILSIETAHSPGSLAIAQTSEIVAFQSLEPPLKTTESFASVADQMLRQAGWGPESIELVATTQGPGSFTGCRIGVTAAKVFAYATGAAVIGVNTLELIAFQSTIRGDLWVVMDAQRGQLFVSRFHKQQVQFEPTLSTTIMHVNDWLQSLNTDDSVTGPGLIKIADRIPQDVHVADESEWRPRADALALLAHQKFQGGTRDDIWRLSPNYYRKSAAEEKADAAGKD